jgi:hypothetical protein
MSPKPKASSVFHSLTQAQRDQLEYWLFEENIAYETAAKRCKAKFKVNLYYRKLEAFYREIKRKRNIAEILSNTHHANSVIKKLADNPVATFKAIMELVGQVAFNSATLAAAGQTVDLEPLRQAIEIYLDTRKDDRDAIKVALEREKWELDVARLCFEHHAELQTITADQSMDEDARLLAIRRRLFGANVPA